jgi:hypothetical protein
MGAMIAPIGAASLNCTAAAALSVNDGGFLGGPSMATTQAFHYRGYEVVPKRQWANWCVGIYAMRADLPLMTQSTLRTLAPRKEEAVAEAKHTIDEVLDHLND